MGDGFETTDVDLNMIGKYWACAKAFQFTPAEVDSIDGFIIDGMLILEQVKNEKEQDEMRKANRR